MIRLPLLALALMLTGLAAAARADDAPPRPAQVSLLPGWQMEDGRRMAALRIRLAPGWKTYWRSPGDAGIPPLFDWSGSRNVSSVRVHWPAPEVVDSGGMRIIAYHGDVVLPVELTPTDPAAPMRVALQADMGVCHDICVPLTAALQGDLAGAGRRDPAIVAALLDQPVAGQGRLRCSVVAAPHGMRVRVEAPHPPAEAVIELTGAAAWVSRPRVAGHDGGMVAEAEVTGAGVALDRSALRLTLLPEAGGAVEYSGCD